MSLQKTLTRRPENVGFFRSASKWLSVRRNQSSHLLSHDKSHASAGFVFAPICQPEQRKKLLRELQKAELLGQTRDQKKIYLVNHKLNSSVMREIGRLRELSFRAIGEGTLKQRDLDLYDRLYRHIVLWDDQELEIVGSYRIGEAFKMQQLQNETTSNFAQSLYTSELFDYQAEFKPIFRKGIELGRSFIQPKYWCSRSLDVLWQGIGAYLAQNPDIRFLFGAVSISNDYPDLAKQEIVGLYRHFYQPRNALALAKAKNPFVSNRAIQESYRSKSLAQAHQALRRSLTRQHVVLPTLYKHYGELCEIGGLRLIDFNIDPDFSFCIDGLIVADLEQIKESKKRRYLQPKF